MIGLLLILLLIIVIPSICGIYFIRKERKIIMGKKNYDNVYIYHLNLGESICLGMVFLSFLILIRIIIELFIL